MPRPQPFLHNGRIAAVLLGVVTMTGGFTGAAFSASPREPSAGQFSVIVHADNRATTISRDELSKVFLKRNAKWPDGQHVEPVDLKPDAAARIAFTDAVHRKAVRAIRAFWQQQIFSGRDVPPPEKNTETEVLEFVKQNPGAVGYVSADVRLIDGVKTLVVK